MEFISSLLKRPMSLSSTPTEQGQTTPRPTTPQQLNSSPLSFDRVNSTKAREQNIINIMETLNDLSSTTASAPATRASSPKISQILSRSQGTSPISNDNGSGPNSTATCKTIEELLLQINDNLSLGDVNTSKLSQHYLPNRAVSVCPSALTKVLSSELNANVISENVRGILSLQPKESLALETLPGVMAPAANKGSSSTIIGNIASDKTCRVMDEPHTLGDGVTDLDETKTSEMSTQLRLNTGESNTTSSPYLKVNMESDTATSSDNEIFAECQSHQMVVPYRDYAFIDEEGSFENSEIESYFSAANSRNTTLTNVGTDPLSLTQERNGNEHDDMQPLLSDSNGNDMLVQQTIHPLDVTYEEEPMDVDVSFDELKDHLEVQEGNISTSSLMKENNLPLEVSQIPSIADFGNKQANDSNLVMDSTNNVETTVTLSAQKEIITKVKIGTDLPIINALQCNSESSSTETASQVTTDLMETTAIASNTAALKNSVNTSINTVAESDIKKPILEDNMGFTGSHNAINVTMELSTSSMNCKSTDSSPNFPIKHKESSLKQFPRSPIADASKSILFLEKSEYTEHIETENKKSVLSEPKLTLSNSRKTFTVDELETLVAKSDKNTSIIANSNDCESSTSNCDTCIEAEPNAEVNGNVAFELSNDPKFKKNIKTRLPSTTVIPVGNPNIRSQNLGKEINKSCDLNSLGLEENEEPMPKKVIDEKRRTFNISIGEADMSHNAEFNLPVDLDDKSPAVIEIRSNMNTSQTPSPTTTVPNSPAMSAMQNCTEFDINGDVFKVPLPPSPASSTASPPMPIVQKRPSIHAYKNSEGFMEILSTKEQTHREVSDENDIFAGKCTPSSLEELPSSTCSFGAADNDPTFDVNQQKFENEEFLCGNDLIFNPSDFDYLFTKGNNNTPIDRSSILLKFDPLLGVPVPVNKQEPHHILQDIVNSKITSLSPTVEEDENSSSASICNNRSFVVEPDNKRNSFGINTSNKRSVSSNTNSAKPSAGKQKVKEGQHNHQEPTLKKYASMSVDVIKDVNIDNDCSKSFENSKTQIDEKQINYKMDELEKKIKNEVLKTEDIEKKLKEGEQREEALIKRITDKDKTIAKMTGVIEAYEKAIAELIAEKEQLIQNYDKQLTEAKTDRDSNYQHLTSLETTFADLHVKYGKSKEMTLQLKSNEEALVVEKRQILENLRLQEQRYDKMKNHAMQQLEIANKKLESLNKDHNIETTKLKALLKKEEISRASINEQLQQKSRENAELVKICDELINGQGS